MKKRSKKEIKRELKKASHRFEKWLDEGSFEKMKHELSQITALAGELTGLEQDKYLKRLKIK